MKRREWIRLVVVAASLAFAAAAHAQTVGVGTTKGGATAQVSAALAKVVSANSGMQMRPQPMGGTQQYIPLVNSGELEFGISNMMQAYMAFSGTGLSKGSRHDNLRLVSTLMVFRIGVFVRSDSGIKSVADLKGKRVPSEYTSAPLFHHLMTAFLANGGLEWKDVQPVPQAALAPHWEAISQGRIDVAIGAAGTGALNQVGAAVGGIEYLDLATDEAARKRTLASAPKTTLATVQPGPGLPGVVRPVNMIFVDYVLWAHKGVADAAVERVVRAMYENEAALHEAGPIWRSHRSATMGRWQGEDMPYHPAAIRFFKEKGIWQGK